MYAIVAGFLMIFEKWKNKFGGRFIDIELEKRAVVAASVVELPPRCSNKRGQSVDVYKTHAKIICVRDLGAAQA